MASTSTGAQRLHSVPKIALIESHNEAHVTWPALAIEQLMPIWSRLIRLNVGSDAVYLCTFARVGCPEEDVCDVDRDHWYRSLCSIP